MYYYISKDIEFIDKYTTEQVLFIPPPLSPPFLLIPRQVMLQCVPNVF